VCFLSLQSARSWQHFLPRQRGCAWRACGADGDDHPPSRRRILWHASPPAQHISRNSVDMVYRYNYYFDPNNCISTYALLQTGYSYLHEQVAAGARPPPASPKSTPAPGPSRLGTQRRLHQFQRAAAASLCRRQARVPSAVGVSGATLTGPNVFRILSCLNYVKHSGNMTWLQACAHTAGVSTVLPLIRFHRYMPTLRHASSFLFDLIDPCVGLINAPGSLYIDVKHPATPCNFNPHLLSGVHPWQLHQRQ
jgi:hypothetical protein